MAQDVSKYPSTVRRILQDEDTRIGFFAMWFLGLTVFPAGGFYIGTIASPASNANGINHYWDLRTPDIHYGGYGALVGLALGCLLGLYATFWYPALKEKENAIDAARHHGHHETGHSDELEDSVL